MCNEGYVTFDDIECIFIENAKEIKLIPKNPKDLPKLNSHFDDHNFFFRYGDGSYQNCYSYIERVHMNIGNSLSFFPKYTLKLMNRFDISSMEISGPSIDEFFSPSGYYFDKHRAGKKNEVDLTREKELADKWQIKYANTTIEISLYYGGILQHGRGSDLILHPRLYATFPPTNNANYVFDVFSIISRFLQFVQHNSSPRKYKVYLRGNEPEYNSGYLYDWKTRGLDPERYYSESEYRYFKPYMQQLLQFAANNLKMSLRFLPIKGYRFGAEDYITEDITTLFSAFESEYKANLSLFRDREMTDINAIKSEVIQHIYQCDTMNLNSNEKLFLNQAIEQIKRLGTQTGQTKKLKNVITYFEPILLSSAENLFIRNHIGNKSGFTKEEISTIATKIVNLRSQASHEYTLVEYSEIQAEYLHFLEILVYIQMLKRAGIDDSGIELIIGVLFHCNHIYMKRYI